MTGSQRVAGVHFLFMMANRVFGWKCGFTLALSIFFFIWLYGLGVFYAYIHWCGRYQHIEYKDGVVFTGSSGRIQSGLKLLREKKLSRLLISGVSPHARTKLMHETNHLPVAFGPQAGNTRGNVEEACAWAAQEKLSALTVITTDYHMPRSLLLFHRYAPHISVRAYCLKTPIITQITHGFREYQKFLWSILWGHTARMSPP